MERSHTTPLATENFIYGNRFTLDGSFSIRRDYFKVWIRAKYSSVTARYCEIKVVASRLFGCKHRHGVGKGLSQTGDDRFLWYSAESKEMIRFGRNGAEPLAIIKKMRTFFKNYGTWLYYADTPSAGQGVTFIGDESNKEFIGTFRAHKNVPYWNGTPQLYQVD